MKPKATRSERLTEAVFALSHVINMDGVIFDPEDEETIYEVIGLLGEKLEHKPEYN